MDYDPLNWWRDGETVEWYIQALATAKAAPGIHAIISAFAKQCAVVNVYLSNKLELTLPAGVSHHDTYQILDAAFDEPLLPSDFTSPPFKSWSADGSPTSPSASAQLRQHMKALKYLCYDCTPGRQPLTVDMVKTTHKLLMFGATSPDGTIIVNGEYRNTSCHSGTGYIYPPANTISNKVPVIVFEFNKRIQDGIDGPVVAAKLMYDIVTLHPFQDGNGRLCRLLVSYALMATGEPFPVPLHNGHRKSHKHYVSALMHADRHLHTRQLASFVLECLLWKWQNVAAFV